MATETVWFAIDELRKMKMSGKMSGKWMVPMSPGGKSLNHVCYTDFAEKWPDPAAEFLNPPNSMNALQEECFLELFLSTNRILLCLLKEVRAIRIYHNNPLLEVSRDGTVKLVQKIQDEMAADAIAEQKREAGDKLPENR